MKAATSVLWFFVAGCAGCATLPPGRVGQALEIGACAASDILPGIPATVSSLLEQDRTVAERTIAGVITGAGALAKGYACYLRSLATQRSQAGEVTQRPEEELIRSRAKACTMESCSGSNKAAAVLQDLRGKGLVRW